MRGHPKGFCWASLLSPCLSLPKLSLWPPATLSNTGQASGLGWGLPDTSVGGAQGSPVPGKAGGHSPAVGSWKRSRQRCCPQPWGCCDPIPAPGEEAEASFLAASSPKLFFSSPACTSPSPPHCSWARGSPMTSLGVSRTAASPTGEAEDGRSLHPVPTPPSTRGATTNSALATETCSEEQPPAGMLGLGARSYLSSLQGTTRVPLVAPKSGLFAQQGLFAEQEQGRQIPWRFQSRGVNTGDAAEEPGSPLVIVQPAPQRPALRPLSPLCQNSRLHPLPTEADRRFHFFFRMFFMPPCLGD